MLNKIVCLSICSKWLYVVRQNAVHLASVHNTSYGKKSNPVGKLEAVPAPENQVTTKKLLFQISLQR